MLGDGAEPQAMPFYRVRRELEGSERYPISTPAGGEALLNRPEHDILELLSEGSSNRAIAEILGLTESAVWSHLNRIFKKLALSGRPDIDKRVAAARIFWESQT